MTTLITGMSGFVGTHLARWLKDQDEKVVPLALDGKRVDLREAEQVEQAVAEIKPDRVYHLAAQSSVKKSWVDRELTFAVNLEGTLNLLNALIHHAPKTRLLLISTGAVYGGSSAKEAKEFFRKGLPPEEAERFIAFAEIGRPVKETDLTCPLNPYAKSKMQAEAAGYSAYLQSGLDARIVRPLGHTGPGQRLGFVVPDLASQVAAIATHEFPPIVRVGRLDISREFADVRDVVRAYHLIMENGEPGEVYNLATNEPHPIEEVAVTLLELAGLRAQIVQENDRPHNFWPEENSPKLDTQKIEQLGFHFQVPFTQTLSDVLREWIERIRDGQATVHRSLEGPGPAGQTH